MDHPVILFHNIPVEQVDRHYRVHTVRNVRGKRVFFAWVRECQGKSGKSGKHSVVRGKIAFSFCRSGKSFIFYHQRSMYNTLITR